MSNGKFKPGHPRLPGAGRAPGTPNKRTAEFAETLAKHNFNAAEALLELYEKAKVGIEYGNRDEKPKYLKIAADLAMDIADRVYPRIKSIEHKQSNPYEGMTPEQKLEIMRAASRALEEQLARPVGNNSRVVRDSSENSE
jgi:hypothetical protein